MEMLEMKKVCRKVSYGGENRYEIKNLDLSISNGESVYILGDNREALTELIMLMGLVTRPDKGSILVDSEDTGDVSIKELGALRNRYYGYIGDSFPLVDSWTVIKNVEVPLMYSREKPKVTQRRSMVWEMLEAVGLHERARTKAGELTKFENLKAQIARAFVNNERIILADNPLLNLNEDEKDQAVDLIFKLSGDDRIIIMTGLDGSFSQRFMLRVMLKDGILLQEYWGKKDGMDESVYTVLNTEE